MSSTFFGLNIGQTGLYAYQAALDTTAHNITNAETNGYSRQVLGLQAGRALRVNSTYGMAGTGVSVTGVIQMRDQYYDIKYWNNRTVFGEYSFKNHYMTELENYFNEVSVEGFTTTYNSFYDSLQELSKNPSSLTVRTQVISFAESLTEYFHSVSENLKITQRECNFEISNQVDKINSIAQQIATLTKQINTLEIRGGTANDLRDQRALLIDDLSEIASTSVEEHIVGDGVGLTTYIVKIDGQVLVDGIDYRTLKVVPRKEKINQNDVDGLYDITWDNGQNFNMNSPTLGGALQALIEVRDGNNGENLRGKVGNAVNEPAENDPLKTVTKITIIESNINAIEKLNIPEEGILTIHNKNYLYSGFKLEKVGEDFVYTFELKEKLDDDKLDSLKNESASIGKKIDYKGIPYYMSQLNEWVRTYSKAFNEIHREGRDLNNEVGMDFFTANNPVNGRNYSFGPLKDSPDHDTYDFISFDSNTGGYYDYVDKDDPMYGSYYFMTAENFVINKELLEDPSKLAGATDVINGIENNDIIKRLIALKDNNDLFIQGNAEGFFQTFVAEIGIDTEKAKNFSKAQENILKSIENQRLSISGVDIDEEAMNLVRYQNAYNLSAKVITVMDEIYNKLINDMGA